MICCDNQNGLLILVIKVRVSYMAGLTSSKSRLNTVSPRLRLEDNVRYLQRRAVPGQMISGDSDDALVQRWRAGDGDAFATLFERHASALYNLAYRLTYSHEDAEDLLQSAVLRALSSSARCSGGTGFPAWMRRIVINLFLDRARSRQQSERNRTVSVADWDAMEQELAAQYPRDTPRSAMEQGDLQIRVENALRALPMEYRTAIVLCDIEGHSYAEIAQLQGIPVETVRTRLRRGRMLLRQALHEV